MRRFLRYAGVAGLAGIALSASGLAATAANAAPTTVYVSPTGSAGAGGSSCGTATFSSIQAAVQVAGCTAWWWCAPALTTQASPSTGP